MKNKILILLMITPFLIKPSFNEKYFNQEFNKCTRGSSQKDCLKNLSGQIRNELAEKRAQYNRISDEINNETKIHRKSQKGTAYLTNPAKYDNLFRKKLQLMDEIAKLEKHLEKCLNKMK